MASGAEKWASCDFAIQRRKTVGTLDDMNTDNGLSHVPGFVSVKRDDESFRLFEINNGYTGCSWHFHPEFQLGYVASGAGEKVIGDCVHAIEPGEVVLLGPNLPHVWRYDSPTMGVDINAIAVHFREDFLGGDFMNKPEMRDLRLLLARASQGLQVVGQTRQQIVAKIETLRAQSGFARLLTLLSILDTLARTREVFTLCSPLFQPLNAELEIGRLRRVYEHVKAHFDQPLDRDTAADIAHMSPSTFSRFFKAHTGMAFQEFVADVRIGHACRMLVNPGISITDVALDCGFADLSTFNRTFRKLRKMTPSGYRTRMLSICRIDHHNSGK